MKSYIQGMITGGVMVFASMVLIGANNSGDVGRYSFGVSPSGINEGITNVHLYDSKTGIGYVSFYDESIKDIGYHKHSYADYKLKYEWQNAMLDKK